jgi:hypothetical protein
VSLALLRANDLTHCYGPARALSGDAQIVEENTMNDVEEAMTAPSGPTQRRRIFLFADAGYAGRPG